ARRSSSSRYARVRSSAGEPAGRGPKPTMRSRSRQARPVSKRGGGPPAGTAAGGAQSSAASSSAASRRRRAGPAGPPPAAGAAAATSASGRRRGPRVDAVTAGERGGPAPAGRPGPRPSGRARPARTAGGGRGLDGDGAEEGQDEHEGAGGDQRREPVQPALGGRGLDQPEADGVFGPPFQERPRVG